MIARWLQEHGHRVGAERFAHSCCVREHGSGAGFAGVSNAGSRDCLRERFRGISDGVLQDYRHCTHIPFRSDSLRGCDTWHAGQHRIEHTRPVAEIYSRFVDTVIRSERHITPVLVAEWCLSRLVVTWILAREQRAQREIDPARPFSRYATRVFLGQQEVTHWSWADLDQWCQHHWHLPRAWAQQHAEQLEEQCHEQAQVLMRGTRHSLPSHEIATTWCQVPEALLHFHYHHKRARVLDARHPLHNPRHAAQYQAWCAKTLHTPL